MNAKARLPAVAIVAIGLIVGTSGCSSSAKQDDKKADSGSPAASTGPAAAEVKADFPLMPAADFVKEFNADESAAAKKYKGKDVILKGTVTEKRGDPDKPGGIRLVIAGTAGDKPVSVRAELAMIDNYTVEQFKKLKTGDEVKVKGTVLHAEVNREPGKPADIELNFSTIVP